MKQGLKRIYLLSFCLLLWHQQADIAGGQELDDILSGFDTDTVDQKEASASGDIEDLLSGFDEAETGESEQDDSEARMLPEWIQLSGSITLTGSVNFSHDAPQGDEADFRDLSMLRATVALSNEMRLGDWQVKISGHGFHDAAYAIQGRDQYSKQLLDSYEQELLFDEVYLTGSLGQNLDIKTGRQVVVWGKSDNLRVTDILNPLDNRLPGMVDIKNLRLPVTMTKLDYYTGSWNLSGIIIHEVRFSKTPVYNSDFFPANRPLPREEKPGWSLDNQQYAMAINGIFSGWDLSLYGALVFDDKAHIVQDGGGNVHQDHNRITMGGATVNVALGNWLLKGEAAWFDGLEYSSLPDQDFSRLDVMAGIEYMGFSETVLSLEMVNRHLFSFDKKLLLAPDMAQEDTIQSVAKLVRDFANDTIQLKIILSILGSHGEDGAFERLQLDYDLTDATTLTAGVIFYQAGEQGAFSGVADNDRAFAELSYEF